MDECFQHHQEILRSLAAILVKQDIINDRHDIFSAEQVALNHRLVDIHQDVTTTLARIETLLARLIDRSNNGTDA
jgi:hypothetical protein